MLHSLKRFWLVLALMAVSAPSVFGFALIGPLEGWQTETIGYLPSEGDDGGPKNLGDGYRLNIKTIYYACDASFQDFFGASGMNAIDQAFAVFNALPNVSSTSNNLAEWPLNTSRFNYVAESLNLMDIKSTTMGRIINLLGLNQPDRFVWTLHNRTVGPGGCPIDVTYTTVQRNFDPLSFQYSSYINGTLFDYSIVEICSGPNPLAVTDPEPVDPTSQKYSTVASGLFDITDQGISEGQFYTGLTRDDIGGLKYLYSTNRINSETTATNSFTQITNMNKTLLVTSNLALFEQQALTNDGPALQALYPDLVILTNIPDFTNVVTTNYVAVLTNGFPGSDAGFVALEFVPILTTNVEFIYTHEYGNLVILPGTSNNISWVTLVSTFIGPVPGPAGSEGLVTNVSSNLVASVSGAFYIVPTNVCGGYDILYTQLVQVISLTNFSFNTNVVISNIPVLFSAAVVTYYTNYSLAVYPVICATNAVASRAGLDHISFVRRDFDPISSQIWDPITNSWNTVIVVSNTGPPQVQTLYRVVTQPDIVIQAKDNVQGGSSTVLFFTYNHLNFDTSKVSADTFGPGLIEPPVQFVYGKGGGPVYVNSGEVGQFLANPSQANGSLYYQWGTFDGTTNAPIVYPDGNSLSNLLSQTFFAVSTASLPSYSVSGYSPSNPYTELQIFGGTLPVTWSLATNSLALPNGLSLSPRGVISGVSSAPAGTTNFFTVQVQDSTPGSNRVTQSSLSMVINP